MTIPLVKNILQIGWRVCRRYYPAFLLTGAPAAAFLLLTVFVEYSVSTSGVMRWMGNTNSATIFWLLLYFVRLFVYAMMISAWAWLAGKTLFEEVPSVREAV